MGPAILFCPGDRPERFAKAAERADAVIVDLEDAVSHDKKADARDALLACTLDPATTIVRVNPVESPYFEADLAVLAETPFDTVMLPKAESAEQLEALAGFDVVALCETAAGIAHAIDIARVKNVVAMMWGAEDLMASMGGSTSRFDDGRYRDIPRFARAQVALAATAYGRAAIDAVHLDIADVDGLRAEALDAVAQGFRATACIHPSQVAVVRDAYEPDPASLKWARQVLAAAEESGSGVFRFDDQMVDEPVLRHARSILNRTKEKP
ncbi:isocitrate dehydrogenase [Platysternon megacephalum]|uniref:Isocitrate dehydrogenase n=1 Tax=Platysternon megacephalum TaxID=55544 RepID=A0A4D9DIM2_9SAUR|nr:isocitrate dehydrogenase [Platysternon megacephalum]